jgi:DNA-directed RNA polymerase subunit F
LPIKILNSKPVPVSKVKEILKEADRELNQLQRKTLEYSQAFSKIEGEKAEELVEALIEEFELDAVDAVQIVSCMPESIEELRVFFPRYKVIPTEKLEAMLKRLDQYRKEK